MRGRKARSNGREDATALREDVNARGKHEARRVYDTPPFDELREEEKNLRRKVHDLLVLYAGAARDVARGTSRGLGWSGNRAREIAPGSLVIVCNRSWPLVVARDRS
eukprot:5693578-Prymnesium_polylepis.1